MSTTQLRGTQILDGTITSSDIDDALEKNFTKVRTTVDDASADFLSSKLAAGSGITLTVVGASGSNQTLRIASTGGGGGGGSSLTISGSSGATAYSDVPSTVVFDDGTGFQVEDLGGGTAKITIASHFKNIFVSGSDTLIATGSDSVEVMGVGGVQVFSYVDQEGYDLGLTLAPKVLLITVGAMSQSFDSRINNITNTIVPSSYVISGTSFDQTTWLGSSNAYARADHRHGTPPSPTHAGLADRAWAGSNSHTGVANSVPIWNASGTAAVATPTSEGQVLTYQGGALKWVTLAAGLAFYNEPTEITEYSGQFVQVGSTYTAAAGTIA
jgi:hypothetical protein